ncbi:MAG: hypothetical protein JF593_04345 [Novosphingobium sp.]|nr:hypothetical protein [Novosphingobium sp.]
MVLLLALTSTAVRAQVTGSVTIESDHRERGFTTSAGEPAIAVEIDYDDPSGLYASATAIGSLDPDDPRFLGWTAAAGYVRRVGSAASVDAGLLRREYRAAYDGGRSSHYTEVYGGVTVRPMTARVSYSPDYFAHGVSALYLEAEATVSPAPQWLANAHVGRLIHLHVPVEYHLPDHQDWRLSVSRQIGRFNLHATLSGGGPGRQVYLGNSHSSTALTAGATVNF